MMGEDQRREVKEIATAVAEVMIQRMQEVVNTKIRLHALECVPLYQASVEQTIDTRIERHVAICPTAKLVNDSVHEAKGMTRAARVLWAAALIVGSMIGSTVGLRLFGAVLRFLQGV